ncbi:transcription factor IIE subunit 1 [Seminavis robusta]|uniref:Transcription factor IIE subunit 1 n=1 Tax=Seminavis robusta TaxID=568900 RepID=A0A9N8EEI8_9STRA|nr:transcription factor IIE subunit 1 [Seminavis robusta]|eukprot:Sro1036_g234050.1 transcription factor IIE subunit 1 (492) ;mRNA; r:21028-22636
MSDLTVYAEALIATVARAFYDDDAICLIDVLIRDKFLRDDDMAPRLSLPAKKLRATLQFLQEEHLVKSETVDDLAQGGSQATKFWYIDYNHAVHTIRFRLHLLRKQLEAAELRARSSSFYLCPGYKDKRCNGRYTEEEAQQVVDFTSGLFLCQECAMSFENDPNAPPKTDYTLHLVDNSRHLKEAVDNLRRVTVQLSGKTIGNHQIRNGIYDLLQKVRGKGKSPITSNLPSENFALGIGSKRLAGTGRTAGIKARKLEQQGVADSAKSAKNYLVGAGRRSAEGTDDDLTFLKNAMGNEIAFSVEKGGGARANLLATKRRRRLKLLDAAASRVGPSLPLHVVQQREKEQKAREEAEAQAAAEKAGKKRRKLNATGGLDFLEDNIGRANLEDKGKTRLMAEALKEDELDDDNMEDEEEIRGLVLAYDTEDVLQLTDEMRKAAFQSQYKTEMGRQAKILRLQEEAGPGGTSPNKTSPTAVVTDAEDNNVEWEDG